jgi:hypothetical protein
MHEFLQRDLEYVIRLDEVVWGGALLALTIAIHGVGMLLTVTVSNGLRGRFERARSQYPAVGLGIIILAAWMIVLINLTEVMVWAGFYVWKGAQPNPFSAFYNALLNYTTLQAGYLPQRWRLLEGMLGISGLLTFAWSTSVLFSLAQEFQEKALLAAKQRWEKLHAARAAVKPHRSDDSDRV